MRDFDTASAIEGFRSSYPNLTPNRVCDWDGVEVWLGYEDGYGEVSEVMVYSIDCGDWTTEEVSVLLAKEYNLHEYIA